MKNILILAFIGLASDEDPSVIFAKRMSKAIEIIAEHHFTPTSAAQLTEWSIRGLYEASKQPVPGNIGKQLMALDKAQDRHRLLIEAHRDLRQRRKFKENEEVDLCLAAISAKLDPPERPTARVELQQWIPEIRRDHGVGLKLESDPKTGMLRVVTPIFNGPAHKAGIRAGDVITEIRLDTDRDGVPFVAPNNQGKPAPRPQIHSTKGMTVDEAGKLLRGKAGTQVTLKVIQAKP